MQQQPGQQLLQYLKGENMSDARNDQNKNDEYEKLRSEQSQTDQSENDSSRPDGKSARELNVSIATLGALGGMAIPQNNIYSKNSNDPMPNDIRGNKKEGDEYDTIGNVLKKGGIRKVIIIIIAVIFALILLGNGLLVWGGFGGAIDLIHKYNKSGITLISPGSEEIAQVGEIDPEAKETDDYFPNLLKFHTQGDLVLTLKRAESGKWTDVYSNTVKAKEGYLFVTGSPSSAIEFHIIADGKSLKSSTDVNDRSFTKDDTYQNVWDDQVALNKERPVILFFNEETQPDIDAVPPIEMFDETLKNVPEGGCYLITVQDTASK